MQRKLHFDWTDLSYLINDGLSLREIGRIKGCSHDAVRKAINRMGLNYRFDRSAYMIEQIKNGLFNDRWTDKNRAKWVILKCDFCGKEFKRRECQTKEKHHFCNRHCRAKWVGSVSTQTIEYKEKKRQIALKNGNRPPLMVGEDHWNWRGGISIQSKTERQSTEYIKWRKAVLSKDNYTCQICGIRGGELSAHHKKSWSEYPELRYDVNNGECLHYDCHMELHGLKKKLA